MQLLEREDDDPEGHQVIASPLQWQSQTSTRPCPPSSAAQESFALSAEGGVVFNNILWLRKTRDEWTDGGGEKTARRVRPKDCCRDMIDGRRRRRIFHDRLEQYLLFI